MEGIILDEEDFIMLNLTKQVAYSRSCGWLLMVVLNSAAAYNHAFPKVVLSMDSWNSLCDFRRAG